MYRVKHECREQLPIHELFRTKCNVLERKSLLSSEVNTMKSTAERTETRSDFICPSREDTPSSLRHVPTFRPYMIALTQDQRSTILANIYHDMRWVKTTLAVAKMHPLLVLVQPQAQRRNLSMPQAHSEPDST